MYNYTNSIWMDDSHIFIIYNPKFWIINNISSIVKLSVIINKDSLTL
jgi:hypothetical protein